MQTETFEQLMNPVPSYYIIDGTFKTYDRKNEIKKWAGYWNKEMRCWQIDNPDDQCRRALKNAGLILQFARNK